MRRSPLLPALLLALLGQALVPAPARAQSTEDRALAAVLFEDGRKLMDAGQVTEACPKLEESQRLDPGGGTLLNLALCHEKLGKTATAWAEFLEARGIARADGRDDRIAFAEEHLQALSPRLTYLVVVVPADVRLDGLEISRNGRPLPKATWGTRIPIDPGPQHLEARAPGHEPWSTDVEGLTEAAAREIPVPRLVAKPPPPAPTPVAPPSAAPAKPQPPPERSGLSPMAWAGVGLGSAALASWTATAISGGIAAERRATSEELAPTCDPGCSEDAVAANDQAKLAADVSTGTLIAGGVLAAAGAVLLVVGLDEGPDGTTATRARLELRPQQARLVMPF